MHVFEFDFTDLRLPALAGSEPERRGSGYIIPSGPISILHPFGETEFFRHGWNSWSPTGWVSLADEPLGIRDDPLRLLTADDAAKETPHAHSGSAVGALSVGDGDVLLLGAIGLGSPRVGGDRRSLWGESDDDSCRWFVAKGPEHVVFEEYARLLAEHFGHRSGRAGRVWCSWYSYFEDIDEELIAATVDDLAGHPFDVVQLDDGWEPIVGDWRAGSSFPAGMKATADRISAAGFRPGLWLAPLIALPDSDVVSQHPEYLVRDETGAPLVAGRNWNTHYFALDTTRPDVQEHLRAVFRDVVAWGFTYLKLDFMYAGAIPGVRSTDTPREQVYRDAISLIREAVGDDVYLLGCGVPMIPSIGVFDGARIGPDVAAFWDNDARGIDPSGAAARNSVVNSIHRLWLKPAYEIDPDVVYFRSARNLLTDEERQLLRDMALLADFPSTSDPIGWLTRPERDLLAEFFTEAPAIERLDRYRFSIDGRIVDFAPALARELTPGASSRIG